MATLDERSVAADPMDELAAWLEAAFAADIPNAHAMVLATASADGRPSARTVLCKDVDTRGLTFFTNTRSRKGRELAANPYGAGVFYWQPLERQVTLEGPVEPVSAEEADVYWATRPRGSQLAASASPQSEPIAGRAVLEERFAELEAAYAGADVPRPPHWSGYRLLPEAVVFWQHRADRLHDRVRYRPDPSGGWQIDRLAP
jgi:pyridoxamine 5'-phosphate oxidase